MLRHSFVSPRRRDGPPNIWDTPDISGNVFANPQASSSAPYPQELNSTWKKTIEEPIHMSTAEKSDRPERNQDLRCQSGPSAKDSVIISGGDSSKNFGADQQRLQISDLRKSVNRLFICGMSLTMNLVQNYSDHFGNSQRSSLSPTGGCKEYISNYRKWLRKLCTYTTNINTSDEDKNDTNYINNNDANTDTRKLHNERARHVDRAVSVFLDVCVTRTSWLKVFLSLTSSHPHT